jgi:RimJ/RimL family protein N-acetyltransferase
MAAGVSRDPPRPSLARRLPPLPRELRLETERLVLEPVTRGHLEELVELTSDDRLWGRTTRPRHLGRGLQTWLCAQEGRLAPTGSAWWLTWVLRPRDGGPLVGQVSATVVDGEDGPQAELSWLVAVARQGTGLASEAGCAVVRWLAAELGVTRLTAHVTVGHTASERIAERLGLQPTDEVVDSERLWSGAPSAQL